MNISLELIDKFIEETKTRDLSKLEVGDSFPVHICDKSKHYLLTATIRSINRASRRVIVDTKRFKHQPIRYNIAGKQIDYNVDEFTRRMYLYQNS